MNTPTTQVMCKDGMAHHWMIDEEGTGVCHNCDSTKYFPPTVVYTLESKYDNFRDLSLPFYDEHLLRK